MTYTLKVQSVGSREAGIRRSRMTLDVATIEEARAEFERWRDGADVLSSTLRKSDLLRDGEPFARFSYNGRLWSASDEEITAAPQIGPLT